LANHTVTRVGLKYAECHISKSGTRMTQQQPGTQLPAINPYGEENAITLLIWNCLGLQDYQNMSL